MIDQLDRPQRQQLLRLLIEDVHVTGWSRSDCGYPSTRPTPARPARAEASRAIADQTTAMSRTKTVCVPLVTLDGDSYRLRGHHARNDTLRAATTGTRQPLR